MLEVQSDIIGEKGKTVRSMSHKWINGISVGKGRKHLYHRMPAFAVGRIAIEFGEKEQKR